MYRINILLAEDEDRLRKIVAKYLKAEGYHVIEAQNGKEALDYFHIETVDLIILDVMMPETDGWLVLKKVRETSDIPVIMLTARTEEEDTLFGFKLGADDYVGKPFRTRELIARVKALLARTGNKLDQKEIHLGDLVIQPLARRVELDGQEINLSPKEYDTLMFFIDNMNRALSREQIIVRIWGYDYDGEDRSVDTIVKRLRKKLGKTGDQIVTVRGIGYRLDGE